MAKTETVKPLKSPSKTQLRTLTKLAALRLDLIGDANERLAFVLGGVKLGQPETSALEDGLLAYITKWPECRKSLLERHPELKNALVARILG